MFVWLSYQVCKGSLVGVQYPKIGQYGFEHFTASKGSSFYILLAKCSGIYVQISGSKYQEFQVQYPKIGQYGFEHFIYHLVSGSQKQFDVVMVPGATSVSSLTKE